MATSLTINLERLKTHILELAQIGRDPDDHGLYRMAFSEADMEARRWLLAKMDAAGLETWIDGAANVFGRLPGDSEGPALLIGSHTDTVPCGGPLDGALGVLAGLECLQALQDAGLRPHHPIEVVSFSDEEGRFGGMLGSQAMVGDLKLDDVYQKQDAAGISLEAAMTAQGLDPLGLLEARRAAGSFLAYLELHIEQGPVLEAAGKPLGIVENICGLFKWMTYLKGEANHAGTVPMALRRDAFLGLSAAADEIPRILREDGSDRSRATIGRVVLKPGFPHTIPGEAEFSLVVRDPDAEVLQNLHDAFRKVLSAVARERRLHFDYDLVSWISPTRSDRELLRRLEAQAQRLGYPYELMSSGAGHDAQYVAQVAPVAMIFVPSKDSISHAPAEWTDWLDIEKGANLLLQAALDLAGPLARYSPTPQEAPDD